MSPPHILEDPAERRGADQEQVRSPSDHVITSCWNDVSARPTSPAMRRVGVRLAPGLSLGRDACSSSALSRSSEILVTV